MAIIAEYDSGDSRLPIAWQLMMNTQSRGQAQAEGLSLHCLQSELTVA